MEKLSEKKDICSDFLNKFLKMTWAIKVIPLNVFLCVMKTNKHSTEL